MSASAVLVALGPGCGSKSELTVDGSSPPVTDARTDTHLDAAPPPPDTSTPPRMSCVSDRGFAFVEGEIAGEPFVFENGFSGGIPDMGKCGPDWVLIFTTERCVIMGEAPVPSLHVRISGPPLFTSGAVYVGEATFVTDGGFASFEVEVFAEELSEPFAGGRARGSVMAPDFDLFGEFELPMDPELVDLPFCA